MILTMQSDVPASLTSGLHAIRLIRSAVCAALLATMLSVLPIAAMAQSPDPLPSWNDGQAKRDIMAFVKAVSTAGSPDFVAEPERIATFDNDGTLWVEQPMYAQGFFAVDRLKELAPLNPTWAMTKPYSTILSSGLKGIASIGEAGLVKIVGVTHSGMTPAAFQAIVDKWIASARHPRFDKPFIDLTYQPMLEVLAYFRANGFKTYIVTGGGADFVRAFSQKAYGIPPEQVIGSRIKIVFERRDGKAELFRQSAVDFIDDKDGKPVGIEQQIGRRPIAAFGNSDGDLQMLQWTTEAGRRALGVIVHHTDAEREYAYDRKSPVGHLDAALDAAKMDGWTIVDMKADWNTIFPKAK
jgi:phosphoglycolate phosphatase-like HAD superfamily hydrolase